MLNSARIKSSDSSDQGQLLPVYPSDLVPEDKKGTAFGMFNFAVAAGALPASLIMGGLYQWAGPLAAFGTGSALALISSIGLLFVKENRGKTGG